MPEDGLDPQEEAHFENERHKERMGAVPVTKADIENAAAGLFITDGGIEATHLGLLRDRLVHTDILQWRTLAEVVDILCVQLGIEQ